MKFKSVEAGVRDFSVRRDRAGTRGAGRVSYLEDRQVAAVSDASDALDGVKWNALDPRSAERLWEVSENLVGERFALRP